MPRTTKEWIGKTVDSRIPPRVRLRVWDRANGHCQSCTRRIAAGDKWECDHIIALVNGGEHREANFQLLCSACHKAKTSADVAEKSKVAATRKKHLGAVSKPPQIRSRGFSKPREKWSAAQGRWVERETGKPVERN